MSKKIVILEDDAGIMEVLEFLLQEENYQVDGYASVDAFQQADLIPPDLYLLDVRLPDGNGIEVCSRIKNSERTKNVPVLMMSAHDTPDNISASCQAEGFISKPFDIDDFLQRVAMAIAGAKQ
ncbi:response regulator transcription factor [Pedobacter aquatilis]|uniref:response regulator transcription factor n=1 Tax=Pedobacter aquatilis TaxID=351343 RepID=UPI00292D0ACF|nr:response regulator [Pedobacter aquatilis]